MEEEQAKEKRTKGKPMVRKTLHQSNRKYNNNNILRHEIALKPISI
jgi:hypothetical protein